MNICLHYVPFSLCLVVKRSIKLTINNNRSLLLQRQLLLLLLQQKEQEQEEALLLERKIAIATEELINHFIVRLRRLLRRQNIETICNYIIAMNAEINPVLARKKEQLQVLCYYLSEYCCN